jgi:carbon storage regulator
LSITFEKDFIMLVLSRRVEESIVLPTCEATITVLSVGKGRVQLGISAPPFVAVHRQEVWQRIESQAAEVIVTPEQKSRLPLNPK